MTKTIHQTIRHIILLLFIFSICALSGISFGEEVRPDPNRTSVQNQERIIILTRGSNRKIPVSTTAALHLGNGRVVSIKDLGHEILITGRAIGTTSLLVGTTTWTLEVVSPESWNAYETLSKLIKPMIGMGLSVRSDQVMVTGEILRWRDWMILADGARASGARYVIKAKMDDAIEKLARAEIRSILKKEHLPEPILSLSPQAIARIPTTDKDLVRSFREALGPFGVAIEVSARSLSLEPMVEVSILVAEVRKSNAQKFGIDWSPEYKSQVLPSLDQGKLFAILNAAEREHEGHILASPTLLCRSGKFATFLAGGEIPIRITGGYLKESQLFWKQYGILLKIKPLADVSGRMSIEVQTEVSLVDDDGPAIEGIPALRTNRIQSHFDLERSRTIALSGLIKNEGSKDHSGIPILKNIPILGPLFSSQEFMDHKTELIFFVTPRVFHDDPPDEELRMKEEMSRHDS